MNERKSIYDIYSKGIQTPQNEDSSLFSSNSEDWDIAHWKDGDLPETATSAQAEIATDLHCLYLTQLTMLGDIVSSEPEMDMKRLATVLSTDRMQNVDAWSEYLSHADARTTITDGIDEHIEDLLSDDAFCQLTAVVLGDVFVTMLYKHLEHEDTTFHRLLQRDVEQGQCTIDKAADYLQRRQNTLSGNTEKTVAERISKCLSWTEAYVHEHRDLLETAGINTEQFIEEFRENARQLYDRIGSEQGRAQKSTLHISTDRQ